MSIDFFSECEGESSLRTPDEAFWFSVLAKSIYACLNGCEDAAQWIFSKDQRWEHSFDEMWIAFFDIDPNEVRSALAKRNGNGKHYSMGGYSGRPDNVESTGRTDAAEKKPSRKYRSQAARSCRRQRAKPGNNRSHRNGDAGLENVRRIESRIRQLLFGEHDQRRVAKHGG